MAVGIVDGVLRLVSGWVDIRIRLAHLDLLKRLTLAQGRAPATAHTVTSAVASIAVQRRHNCMRLDGNNYTG